jgi:hypothetical protein
MTVPAVIVFRGTPERFASPFTHTSSKSSWPGHPDSESAAESGSLAGVYPPAALRADRGAGEDIGRELVDEDGTQNALRPRGAGDVRLRSCAAPCA